MSKKNSFIALQYHIRFRQALKKMFEHSINPEQRCEYLYTVYDDCNSHKCICDHPIKYISYFHDIPTDTTFKVGKDCINSMPFVLKEIKIKAMKDQKKARRDRKKQRSIEDRPPTPYIGGVRDRVIQNLIDCKLI